MTSQKSHFFQRRARAKMTGNQANNTDHENTSESRNLTETRRLKFPTEVTIFPEN